MGQSKTVRDIMSRDPVRLEATEHVREAAHAMRLHDIGDVIVERDGRLCGIVTDRDLVVRCLADGDEGIQRDLGSLCSEELVTLSPDASTDDASELMREKAVRRIPIVEDGRAVGIVSLGDLASVRDPESVLGQVSRAPANT